MKKHLFFLLIFLTPHFACLNGYEVSGDGKTHDIGNIYKMEPYQVSKSQKENYNYILKYDLNDLSKYNYKELTDLSLSFLFLGYFEQAKTILSSLYLQYPNEYNIVVNLGTTNELLGNLDSAYFLIKKSIAINPTSHSGSEWVHVKILEAEMAYSKNKNHFANHSILNFKETKISNPKTIIQHIDYQLRTRVAFVPAPNPIMQQLFTELATFTYDTYSMRHAHTYYQFAQYYAGGKDASLGILLNKTKKNINKHYQEELVDITHEGEYDSITKSHRGLEVLNRIEPLNTFLNFKKATWTNNRIYLHNLLKISPEVHDAILAVKLPIPKQKNEEIAKTEQEISAKKSDNSLIWLALVITVLVAYIAFVVMKAINENKN